MASFGKKTRNPGYQAGNNWVICQDCGFAIRSQDIKKRWDGKLVCPEDFEYRHEQDFLRVPKENIVPPVLNPESDPTFTVPACSTRAAVAGVAIAGCAIAGQVANDDRLPSGTFTNTL